MIGRAPVGILVADLDAVGLDDVSLLVFEAVLVQVVDVIAMANGRMSTPGSMSMCHRLGPFMAPAGTCIRWRLPSLMPAS